MVASPAREDSNGNQRLGGPPTCQQIIPGIPRLCITPPHPSLNLRSRHVPTEGSSKGLTLHPKCHPEKAPLLEAGGLGWL